MEDDPATGLVSGDPQRTTAVLEGLLDTARSSGDAEGEALLLERIAHARFRLGDLRASDEFFRQAAERAEAAHEGNVTARCLQGRADVALARGDANDAERYYDEAAGRMAALGDQRGALACEVGIARCLADEGRTEEAESRFTDCLERALRLDERGVAGDCHAFLGEIADELGDTVAAVEAYWDALELARVSGDRTRQANNEGRMAGALVQLGRYCEAAEHAVRALEGHGSLGAADLQALDLWNLGDALTGLEHPHEARAAFEAALALYRSVGAFAQAEAVAEQLAAMDAGESGVG